MNNDPGWQPLHVYHVNVNCADLERSLAFYRRLGFEEVWDIPDCRVPGLGPVPRRGRAKLLRYGTDPRGALLDLIEWREPPTAGRPYPHLAHAGIARLCLRVKGIDALIAMLRADGVRFVDTPAMPGLVGNTQKFVCVFDPDGTVIELMEFFRPSRRPEETSALTSRPAEQP